MSGKLRWLGLAFVEFTTAGEKVVFFDPWTKSKGNPSCPLDIDDIQRADLVLVSHDHGDHIGSASDLCQKTGALLGGATETMWRLINEGLSKELYFTDSPKSQLDVSVCFLRLAKSLICSALDPSDLLNGSLIQVFLEDKILN